MSEFPIGIWAVTIVGLIGIVVLDLTVIARRNRTVTVRDAVDLGVGLRLARGRVRNGVIRVRTAGDRG